MPPAASPPRTPSPEPIFKINKRKPILNQLPPAHYYEEGKKNAFLADAGMGSKTPNLPANADYMRGWNDFMKGLANTAAAKAATGKGGSRKRRNTRRNRTVRRR